jgi:hypothetical protein
MRVERRHVTVELITEHDRTTAKAVLTTDERVRRGTGDAWRKATDFGIPEIGDAWRWGGRWWTSAAS